MSLVRRVLTATALVAATVAFTSLGVAPANGAPTWAPAATATIHPGVETVTNGGQCTANFVFFNATDVFIGQAAHCAGLGAATDTNGCTAGTLPEGTEVQIDGASQPGTMVYSSWVRMQAAGESDPDKCQYNDLALVRIDPADHARVNPSVPFFGGPEGLATTTDMLQQVYSYGNSSLRFGLSPLSPKRGVSLGADSGGWNHTVYTLTPGIPGDSGSGFLDDQGHAFGVLSTVAVLPLPLSNGVGDLSHELAYAQRSIAGLQLANGTEPFNPALL
jgi:hypothetical protein